MSKAYEALIEGCIRKESQAQRELYDRMAPRMMAVCYRYAKDQADAEDMLQEGFVKVFQKIQEYKRQGSFEGWIRKIMVRTAIDHLRKYKYLQQHTEINPEITQDLVEVETDSLELEYLYSIIQELPAGYRVVFNLYAIEGYSHKEIGAQLEISESTSRSQYTRARAILMKRIREDRLETNTFRNAI